MDMIKTGAFLASLRREKGLTQAQLGERLGVTNKTVSRWETGTYMPPVELLQEMSLLYGVTINELLSGERLSDEGYREKAEENLTQALRGGDFTLKDRIAFFKRKWRREHIALFFACGAVWCAAVYALRRLMADESLIIFAAFAVALLFYMLLNNRMLSYVEGHVFTLAPGGKAPAERTDK